MKDKSKKTLIYSALFILSIVIYILVLTLLSSASDAVTEVFNRDYNIIRLISMVIVINIVSGVLVLFICWTIKRLIDNNKIACILPIAVTIIMELIVFAPFIFDSSFFVRIYMDILSMPSFLSDMAIAMCFSIGYTIYTVLKGKKEPEIKSGPLD